MSEVDSVRLHALTLASQSGSVATATDLILTRAQAFHAFLNGVEAAADAPKRGTRKTAATETTDKPKTSESSDATTTAAESGKTAAASATAASDDDFLNESPPAKESEKTYELKDVRAALVDLQTKVNKDTAMKVLKDAGGAETLGGLKPEKFAAVMAGVAVALKAAGK